MMTMELHKTLKGPEGLNVSAHTDGNHKTTAISTIGVQSGKTRIIIAVLVSKDWIELKICDMEPSLIDIGHSLTEAIEYQQQHQTTLKKLETKQTPVEKLLSSADEILANKETDPIVFAAMAENLALAWQNLNHQLQSRSKTLNQSVTFYRRCDQLNEWIEKAETEFSVVELPDTLEGVRKILAEIETIKRNLLESSMFAMNEQQLLLTDLDTLAAANLFDSRPLFRSSEIANVIAYVIDYLEKLQEKRRRLVTLFIQRKKQLDSQYLRLRYIELLNGIITRMDQERSILEGVAPGCSAREAGIARYKMDEIERSLKNLGTESLRLASEIDQHSEEMNSSVKDLAFAVLEEYSSLMFTLEEMKSLQSSFASFLEVSSLTIAKLDAMLDSLDPPVSNPSLRPRSPTPTITMDRVQETIKETVTQGYYLLDQVGTNQAYIQPINGKLHEIQEKVRALQEKLAAIQPIHTTEIGTETEIDLIQDQRHQEYHQQTQQTVERVSISEKLIKVINLKNDLSQWLNQRVCDFMRGHQDMGSSMGIVNDFLEKHQKLSIEMETKSFELKVLLSIVNKMESEGDELPEEVTNALDELKSNWELYSSLLENRILLSKRYSTFHKISSDVSRNLDQLESDLIKLDKVTDESLRPLTEVWVSLKQEVIKLKNLETNFTREVTQSKDPFLDRERGILCAQSSLTHINSLMVKIESLMESRRNQLNDDKLKRTRSVQVSVQTDEIPKPKPVEVKNAETMVNNSVSKICSEEKITRTVYHDITNIKSQRLIEIPDKPELPDRPPMFIQNLNDVNLDENSILFLSCAVTGHPVPKVTWYRDGRQVYCSRGQEVTEDMESKTYSLIIQDVTRSHEGVYTVQAVNQLGKASSCCNVTIKPKFTAKHPQFIKYLEDREVKSGDNVTLKCQISGQPEPKVTWYFNHHRIEPNDLTRFSLTQEGDTFGLIISSITDDLQGNYCIVAENSAGKAVSSGNIFITDLRKSTSSQSLVGLGSSFGLVNQNLLGINNVARASSEVRTTFREMTSSSRTIKTTTSSSTAGSAASFIQQQQMSQPSSSLSGSSVIERIPPFQPQSPPPPPAPVSVPPPSLTFHPHHQQPELISSRKSESITREEHHYSRINDQEPEVSHSFKQENMVTTDKGIESNEVKSFMERNVKSPTSIASPSPLPLSTIRSTNGTVKAPHITRHLTNQLVNPGDEVTFEIELTGAPIPQVIWYRKGIPLDLSDDNFIFTNPMEGVYRLTFKEAWPEDSGLITVKANNSMGAIESNANLLVQQSRRESVSSGTTVRCVNEGASVRQKKDFFTRIAMEQSVSTYDYKTRCMSLDRKLSSEGPGRLFKSGGGSLGTHPFVSDLRQADSFESLPCGYKYSTSSAKSDISEEPSYYSAQEDNSEFKPVWVPKGFFSPLTSSTLPRVSKHWQPVRAPGQGNREAPFTKAMSIPRGDICPSLLSTTLSVGSLSQTSLHSSHSASFFGQDFSDHQTSENTVRAPIFMSGLKDKSVPEGGYISLECEVDAYPPPTIKWYHNDLEVASASGSQIDSLTGGICRLIIEKSTRPAAGKYVCRASNCAGSISTSCYLKIISQQSTSSTPTAFN